MNTSALAVSATLILAAANQVRANPDCHAFTDDICACDSYPIALKEYAEKVGRVLPPTKERFACSFSTAENRKVH
jgi:hypothetical protein